MKRGLLAIERIFLESIQQRPKGLGEIRQDTELSHLLLVNLVSTLLSENIIVYKDGKYSLDRRFENSWLFNGDYIKDEIKELFNALVNKFFKNKKKSSPFLKIRKIWLTENEEAFLHARLRGLELFIEKIESSQKTERDRNCSKNKISNKKVVILGYSDYASLVRESLESV